MASALSSPLLSSDSVNGGPSLTLCTPAAAIKSMPVSAKLSCRRCRSMSSPPGWRCDRNEHDAADRDDRLGTIEDQRIGVLRKLERAQGGGCGEIADVDRGEALIGGGDEGDVAGKADLAQEGGAEGCRGGRGRAARARKATPRGSALGAAARGRPRERGGGRGSAGAI